MKDLLQNALQKIVEDYSKKNGLSLPESFRVGLDFAHDRSHGDLTTPVAFRLAKLVKQKPSRVAEELLVLFQKAMSREKSEKSLVSRWEVAGGGFINFYVSSTQLAEVLLEIHAKDVSYGRSDFGQGKKALIEFVSANPTGPLTIAHGRQAVIGDALARILEATGFHVTREYYLNDTGRQIGLLGESLWTRYQALFGLDMPIPEEGYQGDYLKQIALKLREERGDSLMKMEKSAAVKECTDYAVREILQGIVEDLKVVRVKFDSYYSERSIRDEKRVEQVIDILREKSYLFEEEGALWFRSTRFGDDKDRVLRKTSGDYTYLAPDIAYHWTKFERGFERLINLWGPDHHGYILRLTAACQALGYETTEQLKILIVQLVTLYRQGQPVRMSTRAGEFVTLRELFQEVGIDATRFFFLLRRVESHLDFDLDLAKMQSDENPVYYLQYAHARISSILKFGGKKVEAEIPLDRLAAPEEVDLLKKLGEFPEILIHAAQSLEPYRVVEYLRDLAMQFHKFYALHRVVTEDQERTAARLLLVDGVRIVLRNGLALLGISQPEKM